MVRDISRENGKEAELIMEGSSIEIDRRVLEHIKNPMIHLIRNAIDHGIERPHDRELVHKSRIGRITINIIPKEGNKIELIIADDGAGINLDVVMAAALKLGILSYEASQRMGKQEVLNLIFESGMSTSQILTDMSGRGLGLAIVMEKVEKLGGTVFVELPVSGGTCFRITLPTSLATFRGLLVGVSDRQFVLPLHNVERVARISKELVKTIENRDTIKMSDQTLSLVGLSDTLELSKGKATKHKQTDYLSVVVLTHAGRHIAFYVDEVLGDQEVLVKNLGPQLTRVRNVSSATVLGAGKVVPILNIPDLFKSALKTHSSPKVAVEEQTLQRASLLVAEDSITSRALLKNILESAGYDVTTAVDGIDALTTLRAGKFDLLVSDVEMPRMDGFDLTAKIRADKKFSELPVVLVTALGSREHKERGIDVGANAYIVKRSFDQSNLLDVIRRLL
jgi:two-component system chemotaxis sensor kinase CheA